MLANSEQQIVGVSSSAGRICGFIASELIGRQVTALISTTLAAPRTAWFDVPRGGEAPAGARVLDLGHGEDSLGDAQFSSHFRVHVRHRDGSLREALLRVQIVATGSTPSYLGFLTIAPPGQPAGSIVAPRQESTQSDRSIPLAKALSAISHDLRNFMNAALGMSRLGAKVADSAERGTLRSYFHAIERASVRTTHVLGELLDAARIDSGDMQPQPREQDINAVIRSVCAEHRDLCAEKSVQLRMPPDGPPVVARIDGQLIARVVGNLLFNALKFTPTPGWIEIDVRLVEQMIEVSIEDNGPGIAEDERHQLFVRFVRLSGQDHGGAGLALAVCSELLASHGGNIWYETGRSGGSRFVFRVPAVGRGAAAPSATTAPARSEEKNSRAQLRTTRSGDVPPATTESAGAAAQRGTADPRSADRQRRPR